MTFDRAFDAISVHFWRASPATRDIDARIDVRKRLRKSILECFEMDRERRGCNTSHQRAFRKRRHVLAEMGDRRENRLRGCQASVGRR